MTLPLMKKGPGRPPKGLYGCLDLGNFSILMAILTLLGEKLLVKDRNGDISIPSGVAFEDGDPEKAGFGRTMLNLLKMGCEHVVTFAKRLRGEPDIPIITDKNGKEWTAQEVEIFIVKDLCAQAEEQFGKPISGLVLTVPANYTSKEREQTMKVCKKAGIRCLGIISEPVAAILAYAKGKKLCAMVVDIGGGTTDVAICRMHEGDVFETLASAGCNDVGGKEYTSLLFQYCVEKALEQGITLNHDTNLRDMSMLEFACEEAKTSLSTQNRVLINCILDSKPFELEVTQETFEKLTEGLSNSILELVTDAMGRANLSPEDLDALIFVGGGSRSPFACNAIEKLFTPDQIMRDIDPEQAVVLGGLESIGMKIEEKIAAGDMELKSETEGLELPGIAQVKDITGRGLGVRAHSRNAGKDVLAAVVPQGSPIGSDYVRLFGLQNGHQDNVNTTIEVLEGDDGVDPSEARILAEFPLDDLPAGPSEERVELTFQVDSDGLVHVQATDLFSGKSIQKTVDPASIDVDESSR